ncbi:MAG TPA: histidine phosphatase family protein [Anaerolineae bacterium]|nr:histidine phosphatase family protein [Anaerolineae bacterium]
MTELLLVRHGQTDGNLHGRWQGWDGIPLNPRGEREATLIAQRLAQAEEAIAALYASPLRRAWQTAEHIGEALNLSPVPHDGLKEINFGRISGITLDEFQKRFPDLHKRWSDKTNLTFTFPGGEQRARFFQRVGEAIEEIVEHHPDQKVVVVAHGGTLRACLVHYLPAEFSLWWTYELGNCSLTRLEVREGRAKLFVLDDRAHLAE